MTTTTRGGVTTTDRSAEVQKPHFLTSSYCSFHPFPHHDRIELGGHVSFFDWIVCWHFTQCELCQGCMSVLGDFSIVFGSPSSRHPSPDVRCNQFEWSRPFFLHFSAQRRHHRFESFYERHLFPIANFTLRVGRGMIIFASCLCGWMAVKGICTVCFLAPDVIVLPGTNVLLHWNLLMKALSQTQASHLDVNVLH